MRHPSHRSHYRLPRGWQRLRIVGLWCSLALLTACAGVPQVATAPPGHPCIEAGCTDAPRPDGESAQVERALRPAALAARRARREGAGTRAAHDWLRCALAARAEMDAEARSLALAAAAQANRCTEALLRLGLAQSVQPWSTPQVDLAGVTLALDAQRPSPQLQGAMTVRVAADVPLMLLDRRYVQPGFGVPVVLLTPRCEDRPACRLLPPEGVFRPATAWLEPAPPGTAADALLRLVDPRHQPELRFGAQAFALASDTSSFFDYGAQQSSLSRQGVWGLFGGRALGRRSGVYLLEDYDPLKRPLVMLHGLGSSPLAWARLSSAVWADPRLRARYQVWHVVYATDAPLLVARLRVQQALDTAWRLLDPAGADPARGHVVLIGHSLGAVVSRLLAADSGEVLWNAAFTVPPAALQGPAEDRAGIDAVFRFKAYPGVRRAIFIAAPHQGSPATDRWFGRLARILVGRRSPEIDALRRLARDHPQQVQPALREAYRDGWLNSIITLRRDQPVSRAGRSLMPAPGVAYHTIAGVLPGRTPPGDGVVPLDSALLPRAASTRLIAAGHDLYGNPEAVAEVLRILHEDLDREQPGTAAVPAAAAGPVLQPTRAL